MPATTKALIERYGKPELTPVFGRNLVMWDVPDYINQRIKAIPNRIYCNKDIVKPLEAVFYDLIKAYDARQLEKKDSILTWDGCFNIRKIQGSNAYSTHSWGIAVDINAFRNGLGQKPTFSDKFVSIWEKHGWEWGGRWRRPDGMHFQFNLDLLPPKQ